MGLLKRIRDFRAAVDAPTAEELRRQLGQFEQNVSDLGDAIMAAAMQRLEIKERDGRTNKLTVGPGQSLGIAATVTQVQLATPTAADSGKFLVICKGAGAVTNTFVNAPAGSLINGASSYTIATSGVLRLLFCDGTNYWTGP